VRRGRSKIGEEIEETIRFVIRLGIKGSWKIAREVGVGVSVVQRVATSLR
jgi:hypothetical protein